MTRVMKRQLEEELDLNKPPTIKPPTSFREPSQKPAAEPPATEDVTLPRDDDEYSPAHGEEDPGTGVGDAVDDEQADREASDAEREAVEIAAKHSVVADEPDEKKEAS